MWELFMEQETQVSVCWWSAKNKRPMWPESEGTGMTPRCGARLGSHLTLFLPDSWHSLLSAASLPPPQGIQQAVAAINSSAWSLSNCYCYQVNKFSYFMKQSKAATTTTLGSADCLLPMVEMSTMFGKCLHVITMMGRQPTTDTHG